MKSKNNPVKLTKNCLYAWNFLQVHAGGMIQCCAVGNDSDLGDFIIDHCQKVERGESSDILNSPGLVRVREGLLTGNLRPMCRKCFFVDDRLVTTEFLRERLKAYLGKRLPAGTNVGSLDLTRTYAYSEMATSFTNRCNMSCVYCIQSTQAKTNPYFKMDFPDKYMESTLDFLVAQGIDLLRTCVEGEATAHKNWYPVFSKFQKKYPHIKLRMTTNLSRRFTEEEITLLAHYTLLDVSCDTLDPILFARLRRGGKLDVVLDNIRKVQARAKELGIINVLPPHAPVEGPIFSLHAVVSDITWPTLEELVDYAFANNLLPVLGNYEERVNALAYRENICKPLTSMPKEEQLKAQCLIKRVKKGLEDRGLAVSEIIQGGILYNIEQSLECNYNRFTPYDKNPLHKAFHAHYPRGREDMHLGIVYDYDNIAYNGVLFSQPGAELRLEGFEAEHIVVREVALYAPGCSSTKYNQTILPGYRKTIAINNGVFEYTPSFGKDVAKVLLEVSEYW